MSQISEEHEQQSDGGFTPGIEAPGWWAVADTETVWRVCHALRRECLHCPASESTSDEGRFTRGCYLRAAECVNIVETGNPWRKTTPDLRAPWVVLPARATGAS